MNNVKAPATAISKSQQNHKANEVGDRQEPCTILLMKLLVRSRNDFLRRSLAVWEQDYEILKRSVEEQARQIERHNRIYEDFNIRMCQMEKILQLRIFQPIELCFNSAQSVS